MRVLEAIGELKAVSGGQRPFKHPYLGWVIHVEIAPGVYQLAPADWAPLEPDDQGTTVCPPPQLEGATVC